MLDVANVRFDAVCCRAHREQMLSDCLNNLIGAMSWNIVTIAIFDSGGSRLESWTLVETLGWPGLSARNRAVYLLTFTLGDDRPEPCIFTTCMQHACI